jgi:hypothetical protein
LGANVVVELYSESHAPANDPRLGNSAAPTAPTAATSTESSAATVSTPTAPAGLIAPTDPTRGRSGGWVPILAKPTHLDQFDGEQRFRADLAACLNSLFIHDSGLLLRNSMSRTWNPPREYEEPGSNPLTPTLHRLRPLAGEMRTRHPGRRRPGRRVVTPPRGDENWRIWSKPWPLSPRCDPSQGR